MSLKQQAAKPATFGSKNDPKDSKRGSIQLMSAERKSSGAKVNPQLPKIKGGKC